MKTHFTERAMNDFVALPQKLQTSTKKQLNFLLKDLRYPSLRAKKYDEAQNIWQARITRDYRFYFKIEGDTYIILTIKKHPK